MFGRDKEKKERSASGSLLELVMIVAVALGLALAIQAFLVKPFRIPSESMVPTLEINQRVLVDRITPKVGNDYERGDIVVFKPPRGADLNTCGAEHPDNQACPEPTPEKSDTNFIKRIVGEPGDRLSVRQGYVYIDGKKLDEGYVSPSADCATCNLEKEIDDPARSLLHDGRQPWGIRRQPGMGPRPREVDHRQRLRHLLAAQEDRHPLARTASASPGYRVRPSARARRSAAAGGCSRSTASSATASSPARTRPAAAAWLDRCSRPPSCSTWNG